MFDNLSDGLSQIYEKVSDEAVSTQAEIVVLKEQLDGLTCLLEKIATYLCDIHQRIGGTARKSADKMSAKNPIG